MNSTATAAHNLSGFFAYKNTFDQDNVWLEVPKTVTFVNVPDPYATSPTPELDEPSVESSHPQFEQEQGGTETNRVQGRASIEARTRGLEGLSAAALYTPSDATVLSGTVQFADDGLHEPDLAPMGDDTFSMTGMSPRTQTALDHSSGNIGAIWNLSPNLQSGPDASFHFFGNNPCFPETSQEGYTSARESQLRASTETNQKTAFLLRHFSEVTGRWMDLFDQTTFFSSHIPVKSISNPLLKHAACALAAKQLGRVNGRKAIFGGECSQQANMEVWQNTSNENWALLAAEHYNQAISLLKEALQWDHASPGDNSAEELDKRLYAPRTVDGMVEERKLRRRQFGSAQSTARSDDLLAATAILCEYESLDASNAAWAHHLSGTKSLLDVVEVGMMPLGSTTMPLRKRKPSQARKAIFWNFARQDMFAAFKNECRTRLDTEDIPMWRDAGLLLDENNLVIPSNTPESGLPDCDRMREDMIGNSLIWLVSKMMNLIYAEPPNDTASLTSRKWTALTHELETWFNGVPETFMPSAIIPVQAPFTEIWSSIPVCTATVMICHMAQILMLAHKPAHITTTSHERPTIAARVQSYRDTDREIAYHSQQIVGMCLARPDASVRINALHPLFVAGQCLTEAADRRVLLDLLRGIERDLGWATGYRGRQLLREWGWEEEG
ncbi:MAG: hypothetical protein LQ344_001832 [Seirophora lacunosa]|nr:MAG: hypothetical protein LQ344_001832 [Seirophora lacunosa]